MYSEKYLLESASLPIVVPSPLLIPQLVSELFPAVHSAGEVLVYLSNSDGHRHVTGVLFSTSASS